MLFEMKKRA